MKKLILLSISLFLSGTVIRGGEVFPTSDAIWNVHQYDNGFDSEIIYGLIGDTVINEKTYQKMYFLSDTILSLEKAEYVGGFRTEGEQVWFIPRVYERYNYQQPEFLLYDFSKEPGEYVDHGLVRHTQAYGPFFDPIHGEVYQRSYIQEVFWDEQNRKHLIAVSGEMCVSEWVEGIGSINGFFSSFYVYTTGGSIPSQELVCFKHKGVVEYNTNQVCNKCFCMQLFTVDIKPDGKDSPVIIHIHPQTKEIQMEIPEELLPASMDIYDIKGTLISSQAFTESCNPVSCQSFQSGTYIYRISHLGESLQSGKIIIQ